jgi:UDP-N-acetylglucosamine/UDP-N-acetylgalactosamine diphosphorylase
MGNSASRGASEIETLRRHFAAHGQGHVFRFWERLDAAQQRALLDQARSLDLPGLLAALAAAGAPAAGRRVRPVEVEPLPGRGGEAAAWREARRRGEALLRSGRVGVLVVAGGQATRLGFPGPKGAFPLGPLSERSLFEIQAQKLRRLSERSGQPLPWYVMTSPATDAPTREFFARHDRFGLPADDVFFFEQGMVPSFDFEDRLILAEPGRLATNPDGHGGSLTALLRSGALDDMERRGITTLFYYQVDNPLVRMADPAFLGFHAGAGAEVSCKVVRKLDPMEKVGIVARVDDGVGVVEYTELDDELRHQRDADGELVYWTGNIAIHVFETAFVRRIASEAERWLPFHASEKKIPTVDEDGRPLQPEQPNGRKLERFVFDALPAAKSVCVVEADRGTEFSPVKNASGADSPETARRDLVACYASWLAAAGIDVPAGALLELDHSRIDGPEDARALGLRNLADAGDIVRMQPGAEA